MDAFQPDVLISEEELAIRIEALGRAITDDFLGEELTVICVLKGAFMFCSDLIKKINLPVKLEFIALSSYGDGMTSTGNVKLEMDLSGSIANKNVLIIEDIVDTGKTLHAFLPQILDHQPSSLKICSLLHKKEATIHPIQIDYLGFEIPNLFVVGYGLDYDGLGRNLDQIMQIEQ